MSKISNLERILRFLQSAEKLKTLLRHSWLSTGRQESVAEHSWRIALMVLLLEPELNIKIDSVRALKISIVHDLAEVLAGDHHAWKGKLKNKHGIEKSALIKLLKNLPQPQKKEIQKLWEEYEARKTEEAKLVKALDKLETIDQHNLADLSTWVKEEYTYNLVHGRKESKYNPILEKLRELINKATREKIKSSRQ